jgi:hypothetical protein
MKRFILITGFAIGLCLLSIISMSACGKAILRSFEGKVVDVESKEPIEGAVVLAVYYKSTISVAGSGSYAVNAQEMLTDANGEFKIPARTVKLKDASGKLQCNLIIFKPGYGVFPDHELSNAVEESKTWPRPEKHIVYQIPKLKTKEERENNVIWMHKYMKPLYIHAINEELKNLGLELITMSEEEIWK